MVHTLAVVVHAGAATLALVAGVAALPAGRCYRLYRGAILVAVGALVVAFIAGWGNTDPAMRVVFAGLLVLGAVVVARGIHAGAHRPVPDGRAGPEWSNHIGFTLVALVDGFGVVTALRLGAQPVVLVAVGVGVAVAGHVVLRGARQRVSTAG